MGKKTKKVQYKPPDKWKATKDDTRFVQMYHSQITNKAFLSLSNTAKIIYIYMRDYATTNYEFNFPYRIYKNICTPPTFNKAIDELIKKGFVVTVISGKSVGNENVYRFSDKWQSYN